VSFAPPSIAAMIKKDLLGVYRADSVLLATLAIVYGTCALLDTMVASGQPWQLTKAGDQIWWEGGVDRLRSRPGQ
jgi:hypothetical protein